jgi:dTDP-4-dehydrorhamnose 3,5-epimerase
MGRSTTINIKGVQFIPLTSIEDQRGDLFHISKEPEFIAGIKEIYCSTIHSGEIKAWKKHLKMTQQLVVPVGTVKFVLYDGREDSDSFEAMDEIIIGKESYGRLVIPPNIWYGFQSKSHITSLIINTPDISHDPDEVERLSVDQDRIPYSWGVA